MFGGNHWTYYYRDCISYSVFNWNCDRLSFILLSIRQCSYQHSTVCVSFDVYVSCSLFWYSANIFHKINDKRKSTLKPVKSLKIEMFYSFLLLYVDHCLSFFLSYLNTFLTWFQYPLQKMLQEKSKICTNIRIVWGRRGRDYMVVGFTTTYAIRAYHHWCFEFESRSGRGVRHYVCDLRQVGGFSPGPPVSSTNTTDRHDITEILLKVALNTIKQTNIIFYSKKWSKNPIKKLKEIDWKDTSLIV